MGKKNTSLVNVLQFVLLAFGILILTWSCNKEESSGPMTMPDMIEGKWDWYKTIIARHPNDLTPESTGTRMVIRFGPDDSVRYWVNDMFWKSYQYKLWYKPTDLLNPNDSMWVMAFNHGTELHVYLVNDSLTLDGLYYDGSSEFYTKSH